MHAYFRHLPLLHMYIHLWTDCLANGIVLNERIWRVLIEKQRKLCVSTIKGEVISETSHGCMACSQCAFAGWDYSNVWSSKRVKEESLLTWEVLESLRIEQVELQCHRVPRTLVPSFWSTMSGFQVTYQHTHPQTTPTGCSYNSTGFSPEF